MQSNELETPLTSIKRKSTSNPAKKETPPILTTTNEKKKKEEPEKPGKPKKTLLLLSMKILCAPTRIVAGPLPLHLFRREYDGSVHEILRSYGGTRYRLRHASFSVVLKLHVGRDADLDRSWYVLIDNVGGEKAFVALGSSEFPNSNLDGCALFRY